MMIKIWKYLHTLSVSLPWEAFIKLHFMVQKPPPHSVKTIKARATETLLSSCTVSGFLYFYRCFQKITEIVRKNALNTGIGEEDCGLRNLKQLYVDPLLLSELP